MGATRGKRLFEGAQMIARYFFDALDMSYEAGLLLDRLEERKAVQKKPETLETKRGTKLLISGFWGKARHINYLGDGMIALSWALPCLLGSFVPYMQPLWFAFLLVMRERRDDRWCAQKYGEDWARYREKVPWRIIPHIY